MKQEPVKPERFREIRKKRHALGLTMEQVAARAGVSVSLVRMIEVGALRGSLMARARLAAALDLKLETLVGPDEDVAVLGLLKPAQK